MAILSNLQKNIIKYLGKTELRKYFFLTGGSALAHYYLEHRYSEDLDFFTVESGKVRLVKGIVVKLSDDLNLKYEISRDFETFCECFISSRTKRIKLHFAQDTPFRLKPILYDSNLNFSYDNELDITCNKFSALFDRHDVNPVRDPVLKDEAFFEKTKI